MRTSEEIISEFNKAFIKLYGRPPWIRKNGAWLYVDDNPKAMRLHELELELICIEARLDEREKMNAQNDEHVFEVKYNIPRRWKEHIPDYVIIMFMDELYNRFSHSLHRMEKFMKDFASGGCISDCEFIEEGFACNPENCEVLYNTQKEFENMEEEYGSLQRKYRNIKDYYEQAKETIRLTVNARDDWKKKYKELKKNSVLFSMDDLDPPSTEYTHEDDEIPF